MEGFLDSGFMLRALAGALAISLTCGLLSGFVVLRGLSFAGAGIAHAAFGGVAMGWVFGIPPVPTAGVFCVATAVAIDAVSRRGRVAPDAAIGILFATAMAFGLVLVSVSSRYTPDLIGVLFGSLLTMNTADVAASVAAAALTFIFLGAFHREIAISTFHEELARVGGVNVDLLSRSFLVLLAVVIVVAIKAVGVVLVSALLVMPGATARPWARTLGRLVALSCTVAVAAALAGLALAYRFDLAPGGTIVLTGGALFFASVGLRRITEE